MRIDQIRLGVAIARLREMRGMSREDLARESKIQLNVVGYIEEGTLVTSTRELNAFAKALNIPAQCITLIGQDFQNPQFRTMARNLEHLVYDLIEEEERENSKA